MKKFKLGLFPKVVIAIIIGSVLGLFLADVEVINRSFKTFNVLFAQLLKFVVPLLVLGLVTPSIANLGRGAGKMLLTVMIIAYCSTVCGALFSYGVSSNVLPMYVDKLEQTEEEVELKAQNDTVFLHSMSSAELPQTADSLQVTAAQQIDPVVMTRMVPVSKEEAKAKMEEMEFKPYIDLKIPPICDIMTALVLAFMLGVGITFTKSKGLKKGFEEFGEIVKLTIEGVIIPLLPIYIFTMMYEMSATGKLAVVMGTGVKVIATGVVLSILYLIIQYCIAGLIARKNPFKMLWNIIPAYLTGFSICSSSACIPVTYECTLKNGVRKDIADFVIPLCSTVHMCGSTIKLTVTSVAVAYMFGEPIPFSLFLQFALMQAIAAVAAPGVMGGVLMASVGLLSTILGFSDTMTTLMMTIYLALDGYGPAVNVSGDAAIAVITNKLFGKKKEAEAETVAES
jgi:Na+/H+-dicarboxylate symporter